MSMRRMERLRRMRREETSISLSLTRPQLTLAALGILAVWTLAFTLGAIWGRGSAKAGQMSRVDRIELAPDASTPINHNDEFTFYETLSDRKADRVERGDPKKAKPIVGETFEGTIKALPEGDVAQGARPEEASASKRPSAPAVKARGERVGEDGSYTIQVGSFRSKGKADSLASSLVSKGYQTDVLAQNLSDGLWYRVRVGGYSTRKEAEAIGERLKSVDRLVDGYIVTGR